MSSHLCTFLYINDVLILATLQYLCHGNRTDAEDYKEQHLDCSPDRRIRSLWDYSFRSGILNGGGDYSRLDTGFLGSGHLLHSLLFAVALFLIYNLAALRMLALLVLFYNLGMLFLCFSGAAAGATSTAGA